MGISRAVASATSVRDLEEIVRRRGRRAKGATNPTAPAARRRPTQPPPKGGGSAKALHYVYGATAGRVHMRAVVAIVDDGSEALILDRPIPSASLIVDPWSDPESGPKMRRTVYPDEVFPGVAEAEWKARELAKECRPRRGRRVGEGAPPAMAAVEVAPVAPPPDKTRPRPRSTV
jgi:hypothetical protein